MNPTEIIHEMHTMNFVGNITPGSWFEHLKRENGKPHAIAIILLSEIVYWYRPKEIRDEATGQIVGLKKRFKADKLQRSYDSFADQFGFTKRQVKDALKYLESLGIIDLDLRHITVKDGRTIPNVLFIGLDPVALRRITYNQREICDDKTEDTPYYSVGNGTPEGQTNTETTSEITPEKTSEKDSTFSKNPEEEPFDSGTEKMWEQYRHTEANQKAVGSPAVPAAAGGAFALGDVLIAAACTRLGRSEPEGDKRKSARAFFEKALKSERLLQGDVVMLERAVKDWLDPQGEYAFFLSQYELSVKHKLALRHFGIVLSKAKKAASEAQDRRARTQAHAAESQAALAERQAARPPPVEGDSVWENAKREIALQITKPTFDTWIRDTYGLDQEDGVYTVVVPHAAARDWLDNRLKTTAERTLVGILGYSIEVRFEVEET